MTRGSQEAGFTQPRAHVIVHICTIMNDFRISCLPLIRPAGGDELSLGGDLGAAVAAADALGTANAAALARRRRRTRRRRRGWGRRHRRVAAQVAPPREAELPRRHSRGVHVVVVAAAAAVAIDLYERSGFAFEFKVPSQRQL